MSKILDSLAKEYSNSNKAVFKEEFNLFATNVGSLTRSFLKTVEKECKKKKTLKFTLVAIVNN